MESPRIALYAHDTMGLGHTRRNLAIAEALLASTLRPEVLLLGGARETGQLAAPAGADSVILPAIHKQADGRYASRSLPVPIERLIQLRSATLQAALDAFRPHLLIVDQVARGALGELQPILEILREQPRTRTVLGLREVQDAPDVVRREWGRLRTVEAMRELYDEVWIYGDRACFDPVAAYGLGAELGDKIHFTGYIARPRVEAVPSALEPVLRWLGSQPCALCLVGGGQDGEGLATAFLRAVPESRKGLVVTGPFMPREARTRLLGLADGRRLRVIEFVPELAPLLDRAEQVVAMGGYNTVCELLSAGHRPLLVPRTVPRREQWVRASRLSRLGLVDVLAPENLVPGAIRSWLETECVPDPAALEGVDFGGLDRVVALCRTTLPKAQAAVGRRSQHAFA